MWKKCVVVPRSAIALVTCAVVAIAVPRAAEAQDCTHWSWGTTPSDPGGIGLGVSCQADGVSTISDPPWSEPGYDFEENAHPSAPSFDTSYGTQIGTDLADSCTVDEFPPGWVPSVSASTPVDDQAAGTTQGASLLTDVESLDDEVYSHGYTEGAAPLPSTLPDWMVASQGVTRDPAVDDHLDDAEARGSDPVDPETGELVFHARDLEFPGFGVPFVHERIYRSRISYAGPLGYGWDHSYNRRLVPSTSTDCAGEMIYSTGLASTIRFQRAGQTALEIAYESPKGVHLTLVGHKDFSGSVSAPRITWTLTDTGGLVASFDERGLLSRIEDQNRYGISFEWEPALSAEGWRLDRAIDSVGRVIDYHYDFFGHLEEVGNAESGLRARYTVDMRGDLVSAENQRHVAETYEYAWSDTWDAAPADFVPEGLLHAGCALACAPATSSCDAGGACDDLGDIYHECRDSCGSCLTTCADSCGPYCGGVRGACWEACETPCFTKCDEDELKANACQEIWDHSAEAACNQCGSSCNAQCELSCDALLFCVGGGDDGGAGNCSLTYGADYFHTLASAAALPVEVFLDSVTCVLSEICDLFGGDCFDCDFSTTSEAISSYCRDDCGDCCASGDHCSAETCHVLTEDTLTGHIGDSVCTGGSCQAGRSCKDDCRAAFFGEAITGDTCSNAVGGGCPDTFRAACTAACLDPCADACVGTCTQDCALGCVDGCDPAGCFAFCDSVDFPAICTQGCVDGCVAGNRAAGPPRYGHFQDLNHDLLRVVDAAGAAYLENTYGEDPLAPDFDTVVSQSNGGSVLTFSYRDLEAERRGDVEPPASGPAADFAEPANSFDTVEICPAGCIEPSDLVVAGEFVPLAWGVLVVETGPVIGGFRVTGGDRRTSSVPPTILRVTAEAPPAAASATPNSKPPKKADSIATSLTGNAALPAGLKFGLATSAGSVEFTSQRLAAGTFDLKGSPAGIAALAQLGEITILSDNAGRLRAYPHRPLAMVQLDAGRCIAPFQAATNVLGELQITPPSACSGDLRVAPLASAVTDPEIRARFTQDPSTIGAMELFTATPLVPGRYTFAWKAMPGVPGRFEPSVGPQRGAAPSSSARIAFAAVESTPIFQPPTRADLPLVVFHTPGSLRPGNQIVAPANAQSGSRPLPLGPIFDRPDAWNPYGSGCLSLVPDEPRRGSGEAAPGPVPARATVLVDP